MVMGIALGLVIDNNNSRYDENDRTIIIQTCVKITRNTPRL